MPVSPSREAFLLRLDRTLLNKVRREAQNREMTVTDLFIEMVEHYEFEAQGKPLVKKEKPWWEH